MAVSVSSAPSVSYLNKIAEGTGSVTGNGAVQSLFNFTTSGDLGTKELIIFVQFQKSLGNTAPVLSLSADGSTAIATVTCTGVASVNEDNIAIWHLTKHLSTTTSVNVYVDCHPNGGQSISQLLNKSELNLSAADTIYVITNALAVGQDTTYRYVVYVQG